MDRYYARQKNPSEPQIPIYPSKTDVSSALMEPLQPGKFQGFLLHVSYCTIENKFSWYKIGIIIIDILGTNSVFA